MGVPALAFDAGGRLGAAPKICVAARAPPAAAGASALIAPNIRVSDRGCAAGLGGTAGAACAPVEALFAVKTEPQRVH